MHFLPVARARGFRAVGMVIAKVSVTAPDGSSLHTIAPEQDNPTVKPNSVAADLSLVPDTVVAALEHRQLQPLLIGR